MNNSVVSRLNVIDAIILLTGAKFILHPILTNLSMKLPQYDFNHPLKLKPSTQEPEPICLDLPDDVIVSILSKVDIVTLRRCTLVLSLDSILPQIVSFSTPLDVSLFIPDKSGCWYGRLFNKFISKSIPFFLSNLERYPVIFEKVMKVIPVTIAVFWWLNTAKLKPEAVNFFEKLTGLKLLEVELPAMPCYDCRVSPHLWFRWEAKFGIHGSVSDYILFVFADKANDGVSDQFLKGMKTVLYHTMFHCSMLVELGYQGDDWKTGMTFMSKDAEGNGGMMIGPQSMRDDGEFRFKILQLPSTLKFSRYTYEQEDPVQVQNVMLLFLAHVDATVIPDDNDVIMACLGDVDDKEGKADHKTEIREIVAQILADENCLGL